MEAGTYDPELQGLSWFDVHQQSGSAYYDWGPYVDDFVTIPIVAAPSVRPKVVVTNNNGRRSRLVARVSHRQPRITRARSTPTPAPPRPALNVHIVHRDRSRVVARLRHKAQPVQERSTLVSPPPVNRVNVVQQDRSRYRARARHVSRPLLVKPQIPTVVRYDRTKVVGLDLSRRWARTRKNTRLVYARAPQPPPTPAQPWIRPKIVVTSNARRTRVLAVVTNRVRRHGPVIFTAPSVPTPTPLVRPGVQIVRMDKRRAALVAARGRGARIYRAPPTAAVAVPAQRPRAVVRNSSRRAATVRALARGQALVVRSRVQAQPPRTARPLVKTRRTPVRALRRNRAIIVTPAYAAVPVVWQNRQVIVKRRTPLRVFHRNPTIIVTPAYTQVPWERPTVRIVQREFRRFGKRRGLVKVIRPSSRIGFAPAPRKTVKPILVRPTRRRHYVRTYFARHPVEIVTPTGGIPGHCTLPVDNLQDGNLTILQDLDLALSIAQDTDLSLGVITADADGSLSLTPDTDNVLTISGTPC